MQSTRLHRALAVVFLAFSPIATAWTAQLDIARIYIEYNASANDLGFHVFLDGEDWKELAIVNPDREPVFIVEGSGPYAELGMTELFFEGAEPSLDDVPLDELLGMFPEGRYRFVGSTVDDRSIRGNATLSHAVPAAPAVSAAVSTAGIVIAWTPVSATPPGFPVRPVDIAGYQVIVESFQVTLPDSSTQVTLPPEFAASLGSGVHLFEVLAIDASGNQTITEGSFVVP